MIADDGKFVLRVDDLLHWVFAADARIPTAASLTDHVASGRGSSALDFNEVPTEETHLNGSKRTYTHD